MMDDKTIRAPIALGKKSLAVHANRNSRSFAWGDDFHYRALFEQSDDCIFIISFDLCYLAANPQALKLLGYSASEMVGKPVSEIMALDESHGHDAEMDDSLNLSERILQRKNGTTVPVEISTSIVYNKTGSPAYIQSIARDISKRKEVELAIKASEARNRSIIEALPDLIIRMDCRGKILDYSVRLDHPLYLPPDVVAGKLLSEIWPDEIVSQIMGSNTHQEFKEMHHLREFKLPTSTQTYESRLAPITPQEALLVVRDITEQAKFDEMKSDFINRASHELRTPLTNAILMANLIQEGGNPEEIQEYWRVLSSELDRQKILIDRLLIAGRLESGAMRLEHVPIDLPSLLDDSILAIKAIANKKKIVIQYSRPQKQVSVTGDKSGLQQVFVNLINNAVKFSPEGSSVTVDVTEAEEEIQVAISDRGMGIRPEDVPHLFERFFRGKNVTVAEIQGSGIGLYIVKSIVEELGGRIIVKSILKQGTVVTVVLKRSISQPTQ